MSGPIRKFIDWNKKFYAALSKIFPNTKFSIYKYYTDHVKASISDGMTILDIGGGKSCSFASSRKFFDRIKIIALDVSQEELDYNHDVDEKIVFDIASGGRVPIDDNTMDMVTSSSVLEHLKNLDNVVKEVSRIIKPGGKFISVFPCKFALFAIINQMLPNWLARKILFSIMPESKGICGFKAYYDSCYYPAIQRLLVKNGFEDINFAFQYSQSGYFAFFAPFAIISLLWDFLMYILNLRSLCGYLFFEARKKG